MLGIDFTSVDPRFEESLQGDPETLPETLARGKALSASAIESDSPVLGADTLVVLGNRMLGKPGSAEEAVETLLTLSGRMHTVITGVALAYKGEIFSAGSERTEVSFAPFDRRAAEAYVKTGEPMDKAGAYGIQGKGAALVEKVNGCFYNVMGLPIQLTLRLLDSFTRTIKNPT